MARIEALEPPYDEEVGDQLASMMPEGVPPILLFRTFVKNPPMARALRGWGGYELGPELSLTMRDREIVIDRTCARCGCEYEWGVHVAFFAERAGLEHDQIVSLTRGTDADACWTRERDRLLIRVVDQLHDSAAVSDELFDALSREFGEAEILDLFMLVGWYHAISFTANGARVDPEPGAPRFADFTA